MLEYLSTTTFVVFTGVFLLLRWMTRRSPTLPPGPPLFPLLGNIPSMGKDPRESFAKLRRRYGDIFCVYIGHVPMVVINSYKLIRESLVKQADVFSGRPHNAFFELLNDGKGVITTDGKMWREQRIVSLNILREFGMGKAILETKIHEEISVFLETIGDKANKPQDVTTLIANAVSNVICNIAFGKRFEYTDKEFLNYLNRVNENVKISSASGLITILPVLRFIPGDFFGFWQMFNNVNHILSDFVRPSIQEHVRTYKDDDAEDFISAYIRELKKRRKQGEDTTMSEDTLSRVVSDLFAAGSETTSTTLRWLLVVFLNYPEVQQKCFNEVEEHIGLNRTPSMKDKQNTPYIEATLMEILRFFDIVPLALPHALSEDTVFNGYQLPKGTFVTINLDSALQDPEVWGDPENFRPERFLDGAKMIKREEFIPFSAGRRVCLGESLARMEIYLFASSMIQRFEFLPPDGRKPSLKGVLGVTHLPLPYEIIAKPRA